MSDKLAEYIGRAHGPAPVFSVLLREIDVVGVAKVYADRIETWRNGNLIGKARNLDDALRQAINAEKRELRRRR